MRTKTPWHRFPNLQIDGITYKQHPKWTWLLIAQQELDLYWPPYIRRHISESGRLADKAETICRDLGRHIFDKYRISKYRAYVPKELWKELEALKEVLTEKIFQITMDLNYGGRFFKIVDLKPIEMIEEKETT